jgi:hypothetical protein
MAQGKTAFPMIVHALRSSQSGFFFLEQPAGALPFHKEEEK